MGSLAFFDEAENRRAGGPEKFIPPYHQYTFSEVTASSVENPFILTELNSSMPCTLGAYCESVLVQHEVYGFWQVPAVGDFVQRGLPARSLHH